jgi:hypothetical protein
MSQINPVHDFPFYFLKFPSSTLLQPKPRSSKWPLPFKFLTQISICISLLPHICQIPSLSRPPWFDHPKNIWLAVRITKLLFMLFSPVCCHLHPAMPLYVRQHPVLEYPQPLILPQCQRPSFTPIRNKIHHTSVYFSLYDVIANGETKDNRRNLNLIVQPFPHLDLFKRLSLIC